jgi:hypothetical protein
LFHLNFNFLIFILFCYPHLDLKVSQFYWTVSSRKQDHLNLTITVDINQPFIIEFLDRISQEQHKINELIQDNLNLRSILKEMEESHQIEELSQPYFLHKLVTHVKKRSEHKKKRSVSTSILLVVD